MGARVLVVDDHPLFRDGVSGLLRLHGYEVVGEAADGVEAVESARRLQPDVILMDICMPRMDGLAATRQITAELPQCRVVVLTVSDDDDTLFEAIKCGARGYLLKDTGTDAFFELLEGVARGEAPISGQHASRILGEFARGGKAEPHARPDEDGLSEREMTVLEYVSQGLTNRDIAERLALSENTIKYYLKNILNKLHLRNRAQAAAYAVQAGILRHRVP